MPTSCPRPLAALRRVPGLAAGLAAFCLPAAAAPPTPSVPGFAVTAFATGLDFPLGMVELDDGSLLVATAATPSGGGSYFASPGQLLRLVDTDGDGVADGTPRAVATPSALPGALTSLERRGDLLFLTSAANRSVEVLRLTGAGAALAATPAATLNLSFPDRPRLGTTPARWEHGTNALAAAAVSGDPTATDLYFNVGSIVDDRRSDPAAGEQPTWSTAGASGPLAPDAIHRVRITRDAAGGVSIGTPEVIAVGLRNAAGLAVHAATGDLWLQDNGIDGANSPGGRRNALGADELMRILASDLGGATEDFGFGRTYVDYRTGATVLHNGATAADTAGLVDPLIAFTADPGTPESEGAVEIAFAPASFGPGYADGVFVAFYGEANQGGAGNEENPLVYADPATGEFFDFFGVKEADLGHPSGLLATADALYLSDLATVGGLGASSAGTGAIYRVAVPEPATALLLLASAPAVLQRRR